MPRTRRSDTRSPLRALQLVTLTAGLWSAITSAQTGAPSVQEHQLDNGMTVLVRADQRAPVVVTQLWFPVGSSHERFTPTGVSHALEHMMFKGTPDRPTGTYTQTIQREGGQLNAFTGKDYTAYHQQIGADRLDLVLELEADRLGNIILDAEEFERELEVIREERRQVVEDNPFRAAQERFHALAWQSHPYRQPVIGWRSDLDELQLDDLARWYTDWYGVNQAVLVVAGDVAPEAVFASAERHFGGLQPRPAPSHRDLAEAPPRGERRADMDHPQAMPWLLMGWQVPSLATAENPGDAYALSLLARILDGGRSARLPQRLERGSGLAVSASASYSPLQRLDTLFYLSGQPRDTVDLDTLEAALRAEIDAVIEQGVTQEELDRARRQARADRVYRLDSLFSMAMEIGMLEALGLGWEMLDDYDAALDAVTPRDVQSVAERYLQDRRLSVLHLHPETPDLTTASDHPRSEPRS